MRLHEERLEDALVSFDLPLEFFVFFRTEPRLLLVRRGPCIFGEQWTAMLPDTGRSPIKAPPLREPGQSVREAMLDLLLGSTVSESLAGERPLGSRRPLHADASARVADPADRVRGGRCSPDRHLCTAVHPDRSAGEVYGAGPRWRARRRPVPG